MSSGMRALAPGTLWPAIEKASRQALACGAQRPIETREVFIEERGVRFVVRVVSSLARKQAERERQASGAPPNPFLPYERDLFVADLSATHLCLLNKFSVIDNHVLVITRAFEHQEALLTAADFEALAVCLAEYGGLGFYNGGTDAGASQPHKHLQVLPLPLAASGPVVPIEPLLEAARAVTGIGTVPGFSFRHAFRWLPPSLHEQPAAFAAHIAHQYRAMFAAVGLRGIFTSGETRQSGPYNLLVTRQWMLLVPRSREHFDGISVSAPAFAGSLFVRTEAQLDAVRARGPMAVLQAVATNRNA